MARAWHNAQGRRPRASAYATIARWFAADGGDLVPGMAPERIEAVLTASLAQYHTGNHQAGPAVPAPPLGEDLQVKRLASVPDHQEQLDPPPDGDVPAAGSPQIDLTRSMAASPQVIEVLQNFDERLAGLQELVVAVPAIHELLVALIKAMVPVIELAGELTASDAKLESMAGEVRDLAGQLGITADDITLAQERARSVAEQNGWMPTMAQQADQPAGTPPGYQQASQPADDHSRLDWAGGLCEVHCREDRCVYGCDCPGHLSDGSHVVQARTQQASQPAGQGMRLYGGYVVEPDWARMHDLGEVSDER